MAYKDRDPNPKVDTFTPQTLKGPKTLVSPILTTPEINDTSSDHQYIVAASELAADRTVTLPLLTGNDEFVFKDHVQTLTNKSIAASQLTGSVTPARIPTLFTIVTTTSTGTQNNFDPGIVGNTHILCNGASNITITGLVAGTEGQMVLITPKNGSQKVILPHESGSSTAANRLQNVATVPDTIIAAPSVSRGHALYVYEDTRWRLKSFEQGDPIVYTPTWTGGSPSIGNGTLTGDYVLKGKTVYFSVYFLAGSTTTFGGAGWQLGFPLTGAAGQVASFAVKGLDAGTAHRTGTGAFNTTTTFSIYSDNDSGSGWGSTSPFTWANTDSFFLNGHYVVT